MEYGPDWLNFYKATIQDQISQTISQKEITFILEQRNILKNELTSDITISLANMSSNLLKLSALSIININFTPELDNTIESKLIQNQMIKIYTIHSQVKAIEKQTENLKLQTQSDIDYIISDSKVYMNSAVITAKSSCLNTIMNTDAEYYGDLGSSLNLGKDLILFINAMEEKLQNVSKVTGYDNAGSINSLG
jgi:hypothetical protein